MKIENLYEGQIIKNYRALCKLLNIEVVGGNAKMKQIKELKRYCDFKRDKNKYIITKIFDEPIQKKKLPIVKNEYKNLKVPLEQWNNYGVYSITLDNDIYIGSTITQFRKRYREHEKGYDKMMKHTYDLINNGGVFEVVFDMTGINDVDLIRMVEDEFIKYYLEHPDWNLINKYKSSYKDKKENPYKNIKIPKENYYEALQLLYKHNLIDIVEDIDELKNVG